MSKMKLLLPSLITAAIILTGCAIERSNHHPIALKNRQVELNPQPASWDLLDGGPGRGRGREAWSMERGAADGPETPQRWDAREGYNFGTGPKPQPTPWVPAKHAK